MRDPNQGMESTVVDFKMDDVIFLSIIAIVAGGVSLAVFMACFSWFKRDIERKMIKAMIPAVRRDLEELILTGSRASVEGELVAQFKINKGKQVVSVLESEGKRFIHVDGEISSREKANMVRYLKLEGFMS